jgi:hypothetical protein
MSNYDNDLKVITSAKYGSTRKISELHALLVLAETLQIKLAAKPAQLTSRQLSLMNRILDMHLTKIHKRITQIERMNESKANKKREEKTRLQMFEVLAQSGAITALVSESRISRSERLREDKEHAQQTRAAAVPAIQRQFAEVGFNPRASSAEREEWARLRDINRHAIPGHDLSTQGDEIMQRMNDIENERGAACTTKPNETSVTDDISTIGSVDEWSKLI